MVMEDYMMIQGQGMYVLQGQGLYSVCLLICL